MISNLRKKFLLDGKISLKNILSTTEKKMLKSIVYDNFKKHIFLSKLNEFNIEDKIFHKKIINLRKLKPKEFGEIYDRINLNSKFRSLFYSEKFLNLFAKTLNVKNNQIFLNGFAMRFDFPNDKRNNLGWHQDSSYYMMGFPKFNAGVCWTPLTKNTESNGALKLIPESHARYIKTKSKKKNDLSSEQKKINISKKELERIINMNQNIGDVSMLHMNLKHRSGENTSKKVRITIGCRFIDMSKSFNVGKENYKFNNNKYNKL